MDYLFCSEGGIWAYGIINRGTSVIIFGGECTSTGSSSRVVKYAFDSWTQIGNLQSYRNGHRAVSINDQVYIIGGRHGT